MSSLEQDGEQGSPSRNMQLVNGDQLNGDSVAQSQLDLVLAVSLNLDVVAALDAANAVVDIPGTALADLELAASGQFQNSGQEGAVVLRKRTRMPCRMICLRTDRISK